MNFGNWLENRKDEAWYNPASWGVGDWIKNQVASSQQMAQNHPAFQQGRENPNFMTRAVQNTADVMAGKKQATGLQGAMQGAVARTAGRLQGVADQRAQQQQQQQGQNNQNQSNQSSSLGTTIDQALNNLSGPARTTLVNQLQQVLNQATNSGS